MTYAHTAKLGLKKAKDTMIKAIICDMDGLLSDTETLHIGSYKEVFRDLGIVFSDEIYKAHWIRDGKGIADYVREYNLHFDLDNIREMKKTAFLRLVKHEVQPMPGAASFLRRFHGTYPLALASSSYRYGVDGVLAGLGLTHFFDHILSKECVTNLKPAPDIFLKAADKLGVSPEECVVLEDAEKGIRAAHAAGMYSIAIPTEYTISNEFSLASVICNSLDEVTHELIGSL